MSMFPIASITITSNGTNPTFTSIPQNFKHLQLRCYMRAAGATNYQYVYFRFNGDTGGNYNYHYVNGNGSSVVASGGAPSSGYGLIGYSASNNNTTNAFSTVIIDILDYTSTTKNKTLKALNGMDINGSGSNTGLWSALWLPSTIAAITQIDTGPDSYGCLAGSRFDLYGINTSSATGA